jgi:hypothetical protein
MTHLLNSYLILLSAFLFGAGFAFGSPAHSSVIAEMVSEEELASGYTPAGLQMDVSGIVGPLLSARHPSLLSKSISFRSIRHSVVLVARNAGDLRCEGDTPKVPYQLCGFTN